MDPQNLPSASNVPTVIVCYLDPLAAAQLLLTTMRGHDFENMELSAFLLKLHDDLVGAYPEIDHLLKDTSLTVQDKIAKSKLIFGNEE